MSAVPQDLPAFRRMNSADLDAVVAIEREIYTHPWTRGNFTDSLAAGYECWVMEGAGQLVGYGVVMVAAGEAHLLNLSVAAGRQRRGLGSRLLAHLTRLARDSRAAVMYLEVRPSNPGAIRLYERVGFRQIGVRRDYYPAADGREDAVIMEKSLT